MAIYHFSAKVISRAVGSSAVAAAAYRSADRLHDERLGRSHDFSNKAGVVHSEVMLPDGAPEEWRDREKLWNDVEAAEIRKDAQLAREIEFAIPREMTERQGIELARDFVGREFVARGMIADLNVHWDIGADGLAKPHAHVMLTMREIRIGDDGAASFGAKVRDWNRTELLTHWREAWADHVNERLASLDIDARVDHRTLEAQGIELEPQHKIGPAASRMSGQELQADRLNEHIEIARANGEKLIANPAIALDAITHHQATFTERDLAMFVHRHSDSNEQFDAVMASVKSSPELVALGKDGKGDDRFTSRAMIETEQRLERATATLDARRNHGVAERHCERALALAAKRGLDLSFEQRGALEHVTSPRGVCNIIGYAGTGKSAMLGVAREAWESAGYQVQGAALSGIAAEGLEHGSGIASRTLASLEHQWANDRERLTSKHVLVIDEAGMVGTRQLERVVLTAAAAIRGGAPPVNGQGFKILTGAGDPLAATMLANALAWRQGGDVAVITPSIQGGYAQRAVNRVGLGPIGQQGNGPFSIRWEGTDHDVTATIVEALNLPDVADAFGTLQALGELPPSGPVRAAIFWARKQVDALGRTEFARAEVERVIARSVKFQRQHGHSQAHDFVAMTVQQAKNREFDGVVVLWPYQVGGDVEQKRRLLYNAVTRAKRWCNVIVQSPNILAGPPFT